MPRLKYRKCIMLRVPPGWDKEMMEQWFAAQITNFYKLFCFPYALEENEQFYIRFVTNPRQDTLYLDICIGKREVDEPDPED